MKSAIEYVYRAASLKFICVLLMTSWKRHESATFYLCHSRNAASVIRWDQSAGDKTHTHNPQEKCAFGHTRGNTTQPCDTERATGELLGRSSGGARWLPDVRRMR